MRPIPSVLDASFRDVRSIATSVESMWRRAGWASRDGGRKQGAMAARRGPPFSPERSYSSGTGSVSHAGLSSQSGVFFESYAAACKTDRRFFRHTVK